MEPINTSYDPPPVPFRDRDWSAWRGDMDLGVRRYFGETQLEAVAALIEAESDEVKP